MNFILKMAWRDSRASRRRLFLYSLSVVLGIAALVSIGSFSANVRQAIQAEAKGLLGADLFLQRTSFIFLIAGLVWTLLGKAMLGQIKFVLFVLFLAIPLHASATSSGMAGNWMMFPS